MLLHFLRRMTHPRGDNIYRDTSSCADRSERVAENMESTHFRPLAVRDCLLEMVRCLISVRLAQLLPHFFLRHHQRQCYRVLPSRMLREPFFHYHA